MTSVPHAEHSKITVASAANAILLVALEPVDAIVEVRYNGNYEDNDGRILENQG